MSRPLELARAEFAERIRALADLRSTALVGAFATLPREDFVGPGPYSMYGGTLYAIYPSARRVPAKVRVFIEASNAELNGGRPVQ